MPVARYRQNTPLDPLPLVGPGFRGLNTELADTVGLVDPLWALDLREAVFDDKGRVGLRKGWTQQIGTALVDATSATVNELHEYVKDDGTTSLIAVTGSKLWASTDDGASFSDITGSVTVGEKRWKFVNFNNKVIGVAPGEYPIAYNGSGTFATITATSGSLPVSNGVALSAYGRLWLAEDATGAVVYSALLDETKYATADGGGSIDTANVWTNGVDTITAMAAMGASFIVFGKRHVLIYVDGSGSTLGISPSEMYVVDTIEGTGCIARDAVVAIGGGDLWFLSAEGVQSLGRAIQQKNNPIGSVSRNIDALVDSLITAEPDPLLTVKAVYSPENQFVLFLFPASTRIVMFDTRGALEDGSYRAAEWRSQGHKSMLSRRDRTLFFGRASGIVADYSGYRDDAGNADTVYKLVYGGPWVDFGAEVHNRLKILKQIALVLLGRDTVTITARWAFDFRALEYSQTVTNDYTASGGEWALGEWGESEWGTGQRLRRQYFAGAGEGQFVKVWLELTSTDVADAVAIQELTVFAKLGVLL